MYKPKDFLPNPGAQLPAPGEVPRSGPAQTWVTVALAVVALIAALMVSPQPDGLGMRVRAILDTALQTVKPPPAPLPTPRAPVARAPGVRAPPAPVAPAAPPAKPAVPHDDRARPLAFYFARWGVSEPLAPIGWTSRIEIRGTAAGGASAKVWVTCPKGQCEAGELPVNVVAHLQRKDMTAFLSIERRESERMWTLLLRPAPGRPDELERWEWYGPPGSNVRTESLLGHVRRMRPDGTFH